MAATKLETKLVPVDSLRFYGGNPRRGDVESIRRSLRRNGQYRPIVVRRKTKEVLAGNHTLKAAIEEGWTEIHATFVTCSDEEAKRIVLVDNRTNDLAGYDSEALAEMLGSLPELDGTGYDRDAVDQLIQEAGREVERTPDAAPRLPKKVRTKPGDLYELGEHRVLCGSSTEASAVERLLDGQAVDLVVTDPPYGVAYESRGRALTEVKNMARTGKHAGIQHPPMANDALSPEATRELCRDALTICGLKRGGAFYVCAPAGDLELEFRLALIDAELPMRHSIVWVKDHLVFGRSDYHYRHESILYGWRKGAKHYFTGDRTQDTVWEIPKPHRSEDHPTMKPAELFERMIKNSSREAEVVYDPFGGSGTVVVAAERLGRRAVLMELDPAYCDVIVTRWEDYTGRTAELVRT